MWSEIALKDDELKAVGCLALESAMLERQMTVVINSLVGLVLAEIAVKNRMISAKLEIMKAVFLDTIDRLVVGKDKTAELRKSVDDLCGKIANDIARRNTVIHGDWAFSEPISTLRDMLEAKGKWEVIAKKGASNPVKASDVMDLAKSFSSYQIDLYKYFQELVSLEMTYPSKRAE